MNIFVALKRVPDLVEDLEVDDTGKALDAEYLKLKLNEFDDHALEEALCIKEAGGGTVTVLALDGEDVDKMLFTALAKGADRALKVTGVDGVHSTRALARVFAEVVASNECDLLLTGVQAADDVDGQLGPTMAALMDIPCVEVVTHIEPGEPAPDGKNPVVTLNKEYSGGMLARFEVDLPAVLGVQAARQTPRYAAVSKVKQIQASATIEEVAGKSGDGGVTVVEMTPPEMGEGAQMLSSVDELMSVLESKGVL